MTTYTISSGRDCYSAQNIPTLNTNGFPSVRVSDIKETAHLYFPLPTDIVGSTVVSATLTGVINSFAGSISMQVCRILAPWAASTLTYSNRPALSSALSGALFFNTPVGQQATSVTSALQSVAAGAAWYGLAVEYITGSGSGTAFFNAFESGQPSWTLTIVTSDAPEAPQALVPNGTVVSQSKPTLSCDFTDNGGLSTTMGAMQVQVDPAQNGTTPGYDSTMVAATVPVFDLANPPAGAGAYAGLPSGVTTYWRVRVQDTSGLTSPWSDWAGFTNRPQGTLTLLTPAAGVLWDPTSDILASSSVNLSSYRVQVTDALDRTSIRYDSGRIPANPSALTSIAVSLPEEYEGRRVLVDDRNYQLHIQAWDTYLTRQGTPGAPSYVESWSTFHFDDDLTQTPIATLTAQQPVAAEPAVQLTWTRASAPDGWIVYRDGSVIAKLLPADVVSGVSTYSWTDKHPTPWVKHLYDVRATTITGGVSKQSGPGPLASIKPDVLGIHLYTTDGQHVILDGGDTSQLVINDRRSTYKPLNLRYDVDIVTGFEGLSGTLAGGVIPSALDTQTPQQAAAVLESIKENPGTPVKLVYGLFAGRVLLRNVSVTPHPNSTIAQPCYIVSFGVNQIADFA